MDKQKQIEYFEGLLKEHGPNHLALDWNSAESQRLRFDVLREILIYGDKSVNISILDVGCGLGDLYGYFKRGKLLEKHRISYTGYDISPKLIEAAEKKYPGGKFEQKDILEEKKLPKFDYVFSSGIFNIRTTDPESHMEMVRAMLERMFELSNFGVASNFLSESARAISDPDDLGSGRYFYFSPEDILKICRSLSSRYILSHDYHPGDFTVYILKGEK